MLGQASRNIYVYVISDLGSTEIELLLESDHRLPPKFLYTTRMQLGNLLWYSDRARLANPNTEASLSDSGRTLAFR